VRNGDEIIIKKAKYYTNIIKTTNLSFYDILRRKMVEVRF
jgi:NAD kinase